MFRVIALDPGGRTGWATFTAASQDTAVDPPFGFTCGTLGPNPHRRKLEHLLGNQHVDNYHVVCERFIVQPDNPGKEQVSLEYEAVARDFCRDRKIPIHLQTPSQAKRFVPNPVLKKLGLWVPGDAHKHEMDAYRHLIWYLVIKLEYKSLLERGWR